MREIILDTETTGLVFCKKGTPTGNENRVVEIGCVELIDKEITGNIFHVYINPQQPVGFSEKIHGLSNKFLSDKPVFADVARDFLEFIGNSPLVAHNASFDIGFLNFELTSNYFSELKNIVIDTLGIARKKLKKQKNSLDALCELYGISNDHRKFHGALLDAELLAKVYYYLSMDEVFLSFETKVEATSSYFVNRPSSQLTQEEITLHEDMMKKIKGTDF
jgi:DNA polymerase-3 subunit epsilon